MQELIATFHIDWKLIIAQLVNFIIVVAVLWKFALKPLMKIMSERTATIEKSLQQAQDIERRMRETEDEAVKRITEARAQALAILNESKKQADTKRQEMLAKAKQDVEAVVVQAKQQIQQEKDTMLTEARRDLAALVVIGIHSIVGKALDEKLESKIVKEQLKNLK